MKNTLHINASFDRPDLLEQMVEQLAGNCNNNLHTTVGDWQIVETCSTETYVSGTIQFVDENDEQINNPFISQFLFTCLHESNVANKLHWAASFN